MDKTSAAMYVTLGKLVISTADNHAAILGALLCRVKNLEDRTELLGKKAGLPEEEAFFNLLKADTQKIKDALARHSSHREQVEAFLETARKYSEQP